MTTPDGRDQLSGQGFAALRADLRALRSRLPELWEAAGGDASDAGALAWRERLERNVLPAIDFDLPVILVAICGGGSTGKSTLLNTLARKRLSEVGFKAGMTQRVLLCGHPAVLEGPETAKALLHRLPEPPVAWRSPADALTPGPPLFAVTDTVPQHLLLIDTPDFDTGEHGRLVNRAKAEPILRTSEIIIYVFTNSVYNNLSNTQFMAEVVGGIGGRDVILVYRISRAASDAEVLEHCGVVARKLYETYGDEHLAGGLPRQVLGIYRLHESDRVARGLGRPRLLPVGEITRGRAIEDLLGGLDVAAIKRKVFASDLREISTAAEVMLDSARREASAIELYRKALMNVMAQDAAESLKAFPVQEAIGLTVKVFLETSPLHVKVLRWFGSTLSQLIRVAVQTGKTVYRRLRGDTSLQKLEPDVEEMLTHDLLESANRLRNRLMDDQLIVRLAPGDPLVAHARHAAARAEAGGQAPIIERVEADVLNLHIPVPAKILRRQDEILEQNWEEIARTMRSAVPGLAGLPPEVEAELHELVAGIRGGMSWKEKTLEIVFALLPSLPPLLAVAYVIVTKTPPPPETGLWIKLRSIFGVNDLWALVSLPSSLDLSKTERKQVEELIAPVFQLWFESRLRTVVELFEGTICRPVLEWLAQVPRPDDPRFAEAEAVLSRLEDSA